MVRGLSFTATAWNDGARLSTPRGPDAAMHARRQPLVTTALITLALAGCAKAPPAPAPFADDFNRAQLGPHFPSGVASWRIVDGALSSLGDHNQPLWLDVPLARNVRVEFTAWSRSPAVDTKVEIFGDGMRHESGYIVILGGWQNTISTIARLGEHERGRVELKKKWEVGRRYRWTVQRTDGNTLELLIDGERVLSYADAAPLFGPRNDRLGFTSWESEVFYDDLTITPLP
ncbi:MAG: hypothetical protein A2138_16545 [Deltaproteobacteria bacterium RBG_16_71_12]|nr:MAG: hypothetical protein A2138_16545 [Deltaproteobacteria bacterium RBG_16_71_12]